MLSVRRPPDSARSLAASRSTSVRRGASSASVRPRADLLSLAPTPFATGAARSPHTVISNLRKVASEHASSVHYSPCPPDSCSRISAAHDRGKTGPCLEAVEAHRNCGCIHVRRCGTTGNPKRGSCPCSALRRAGVGLAQATGVEKIVWRWRCHRAARARDAGDANVTSGAWDLIELDGRVRPLETPVGRDRAIEDVFVLAVTLLVRSHALG